MDDYGVGRCQIWDTLRVKRGGVGWLEREQLGRSDHLVEMLGGQIGDIGIGIKFMLACICSGKVAIQSENYFECHRFDHLFALHLCCSILCNDVASPDLLTLKARNMAWT